VPVDDLAVGVDDAGGAMVGVVAYLLPTYAKLIELRGDCLGPFLVVVEYEDDGAEHGSSPDHARSAALWSVVVLHDGRVGGSFLTGLGGILEVLAERGQLVDAVLSSGLLAKSQGGKASCFCEERMNECVSQLKIGIINCEQELRIMCDDRSRFTYLNVCMCMSACAPPGTEGTQHRRNECTVAKQCSILTGW
jgi:hypothetical protein